MTFELYATDDSGVVSDPATRDWSEWVSASRTRNWCIRNPLQDWLELYGEAVGFQRDPTPDPRTDFREFVFAKGRAFEERVVDFLEHRVAVFKINGIDQPTMSLDACRQTFKAMARGEECIAQGVLWNPENRTYGAADLLVRSDVLQSLFPAAFSPEEAHIGSPGLGLADCHYRVVDIKFTTLQLDRHWDASFEHLPYMAQVFVYNAALGRIQGYMSDTAYLLGRSWKGPGHEEGSTCFERLAPVRNDQCGKRAALAAIVEDALAWNRRVRRDGANWHPIDGPTVPELRPNPAEADYPWQGATRAIAQANADPVLAWFVGCDGRDLAADAGVTEWTDPEFNSVVAGVGGARGAKLDLILDLARDPASPDVYPARIAAERAVWHAPAELEFYVDFETVTDVNDDFSVLPRRGGQAMIYMIGCGHLQEGTWRFECFVAPELSVSGEAAVIEDWLAHMEQVRVALAPMMTEPLVFHWAPAESSGLTNGLRSARTRHPEREKSWREPNWFDFLGRVMREEPVVVKGPMGFGLKNVARSLKVHGLIETTWEDNITDGLGAMVGAWTAYAESQQNGSAAIERELMAAIGKYNEVDCKVMAEAVRYFRAGH